ncbi:MAG: sialate O-acetylesterase [Limisphaerales bacterium]
MRLLNLFRLSALLSSLSFCDSAIAAEPAKLPAKEKLHLYLLIGQSNMAGRGVMEDADKQPHPRVLKFTKENAWAPASDPLHFDKPTIAGVGLGSSFGRTMAEASPDATIGLIPCAVGGTPLSRWSKGGDLYQQALERAKLALKDGTLKGILWHQGEGDSGNERLATTYGERLAKMVNDLRADLGAGDVPFVAGKLGEFLKREDKGGKPSLWPKVNEQIDALPKSVSNAAVVESSGLKHKGDVVHFDTPSLREFGNRYAEAMKRLQAGKAR